MSDSVVIGDRPLAVEDVAAVARHATRVELSAEALTAMSSSREHVEQLASSGEPVYGISTGFGALATRYIEPDLRQRLQDSLVRSHAAGTGSAVEAEVVRAMMLLRLATMASGRTGVRAITARR